MQCEKGSGNGFLGNILILTTILFLFSFSFSFIASSEQSCQDITPVTEFYPLTPTKIIIFNEGGGSDSSTKILIPMGLQVYNASMKVTGIPMLSQTIEKPADVVIINDVSGSMDDKIDDTKEAAKNFTEVLLNNTENMAGLVSYSTQVVSWVGLTNDKVLLFNEIDSYVAMNETCVACGIVKGVEILQDSEKPVKAMLMLTDGKANRCTYGVCTPYMAEKQALNRAEWAWLNYNISIYTVSFSEDADIELLERIANVSKGMYYHITWTDMNDIYYDIASEIPLSYPTNPSIDIGIDGSVEWSYPGELGTTEYFEFTSGLQDIVDCDCPGCSVTGDDCLIDLEVTSETAGMMILDWLNITGCYEEIPPCYDNDGDGYLAEECGGDDCDDSDYYVNPGAAEICDDEKDNDCDGLIDTSDSDCFGCTPGETRLCSNQNGVCEGSYETCTAEGTWPGCDYSSIEDYEDPEVTCDDKDNDCDGETDEDIKNTYYFDSDNDGYGDAGNWYEACWPPEGYITDNTDCDDSNPEINPGAEEVCDDEIDNDCDGDIDSEDSDCQEEEPPEEGGRGPISTSGLSCMQEWECTEWGECINGVQTRTCTDRNNCPMDYLKPDETKTCEMVEEEVGEETPEIVCIEGTRTCVGDVVRECVDNAWQDVETCQWGCEDGACGPEPEEVIEEEEGTPGGLVGLITGSPVAFWGIIIIIIIILAGAAYWKARK